MPLLGAHMSIAGGYHNAVHEAHRCGCDVVQLFTKNNTQWRAKPIGEAEVGQFAASLREHDVRVETGRFGAEMAVELVNDGPFTIWLDTAER